MIVTLVSVAAIGRLALFLIGQLPIKMTNKILDKLFTCDLCLGVWIYFFLCIFSRLEIVSEFVGGAYIPILNEFLTGAIISFVVHLISIGWKFKFSEFTIVE